MDVSALKFNTSVSSALSKKQAAGSRTSFSGASKAAVDIATIGKNLPLYQKALLSAEKLKGEYINAIITAFGTACVAPIFITYNPFSKECKETRKYSAWRQPISAVIQFCATLAILKPFDKFMNKQASEGKFKDADLRSAPIDSYVAAKIKKEHPNYDTVQLNRAVAEFKEKAFNDAVESAKQKYGYGTNIDDSALLGKKELDATLKKLRESKEKPLKGLKGEQIHEVVKTRTLKNVKERINATAHEINEIISGKHGKTVQDILNNLDSELSGLIKAGELTPEQSARKKILESVVEQFENLGKDTKLADIKKEFGATLDQITHNMKVRQMVKASSENAKHVFERLKLWSGMGVALLVLPFACTALNYIYPRLMEVIMPEIAHKRKLRCQNLQQKKEVKA